MKVLGLNSDVKVNGVPAKVTGMTTKHLTLKGQDDDTVAVPLDKVCRMLDEKTLVVIEPS